jgi:aminopeptidase N
LPADPGSRSEPAISRHVAQPRVQHHPAFLIAEAELDISLFEDDAVVRSKLAIERNREAEPTAPPQLNIDELSVEWVILNTVALTPDQHTLDERHLTIAKAPHAFELSTVCRIYPKQNSKLMVIYRSGTDSIFTRPAD